SAARPGDAIAVTGYLGASAGGLRMLTCHLTLESEVAAFLRQAHLQPVPRVLEGQMLVRHGVRSGIDISDGLLADLGHILKASQVGAVVHVEQLPIHAFTRAAFPDDCIEFAMAGGEDYELLFTAGREVINGLEAAARGTDCPITIIGEITGSMGLSIVDDKGESFHPHEKGWDHFRKGNRSA
ncbi:MAG: AIR synthase-related protein, partial [Chloroflexi bacterium]|nr:AIR synthase-related protein [Chloroflexota bacterium]